MRSKRQLLHYDYLRNKYNRPSNPFSVWLRNECNSE